MNSGQWTLYQNKTDIEKSWLTRDMGLPLAIDTDMLNPAAGTTIGAFGRDGSIVQYDPGRLDAIAAARRWVTQDRLAVFEEPDGSEVAHACVARTVHVLEEAGGWALVDIDEDGFAEGYCRADHLAPLGDMPKWRRTDCRPMNI